MTTDQELLLNDLLDSEDAGLTGWEMDFLDSLDGSLQNLTVLTEGLEPGIYIFVHREQHP